MRRRRCFHKGCLVFLTVTTVLAGCHRVSEPASDIKTADLTKSNQLLSGFWQVEGSWRWTAREFSLALRPPDGADTRGATVQLTLYLPDSQLKALGPMTLTGFVDGKPLGSQTFTTGGVQVYSREVPKEALATNILPMQFSFDKAASPLTTDGRELGAVLSGAALSLD